MTAPETGARPSNWAALRNRNFLILTAGQNLSNWGDAIGSIALVWFVYQDTHSVLATAALSTVQRLAVVVSGPVAGVYVDRWDRRRAMMAVDLFDMGVVLLLAILAFRHALGAFTIYLAVFLMTAAAMVQGPAFHSVMARILPKQDLAAGNGLYRSVGSANGFFSAAVGGAVVAAVGAAMSFLVDVGSFLFSIAAFWLLTIPPEERLPGGARRPPTGTGRFWRELREGWAAIKDDRLLRAITAWAAVGTIGGGAVLALVPVVVFRQLHGGPAVLGLVEAAAVVGSVSGGLATGWLSRRFTLGQLIVLSGVLLGLGAAGFGLSHALWLSLPLWAASGVGQAAGGSAFNAFFQASVPPEVMGRTFGILGAIEGSAGPVAALVGGVAGSALGPGPIVAAGGVWMALSVLLLLRSRGLMEARVSGAARVAE